ncbi:MAG: threonine/serine exporter family protein, partial [Janthinobacterium lividum]
MASAGPEPVPPEGEAATRALLARSAALLLANGQTTEGVRLAVARLSVALKRPATVRARWGELALHTPGDAVAFVEVEPAGIDITRVVAAEAVVDAVCAGVLGPAAALDRLDAIERAPVVPLLRFAPMAAAGAAALSVIFGADDVGTVVLVAVVAGLGAYLRRAAAGLGGNPLLQPAVASLLAGLAAGLAVRAGLPVTYRLLAVCPCMVLVPGLHFLNGMIDLVRARIPLGAARLMLASLIVLAICTGLLAGLALAGASFPEAGAVRPVSLALDVLASGIAVTAYATFFNMPWRTVGAPVATGMVAHALRWELLQLGVGVPMGAFGATLVAGATMALVSRRLRLPFGAAAFASVVSLIPGIYMFHAASGL